MRKVYILLLISLFLIPFLIYPNNLLNTPISAAQRALGSEGGAYTGISNSISINPAGLAYLNGKRLSLFFVKYPYSAGIGGIEHCRNLNKIGVIGIGINYYKYEKFVNVDEYGIFMNCFMPQAILLKVSFSREIIKSLSAAAILKYGYSSIDTMANMFIVGGVNLNYRFNDFRFGLLVDNIGGEIVKEYEYLYGHLYEYGDGPINIKYRLSSSYALFYVENSYIALIDLFYDKTNGFNLSTGFEWNFKRILLFRLGFLYSANKNYQCLYGSCIDDLTGLSVGLGVRIKKFNLDYSYAGANWEDIHRITLGINF